MKKLLFIAISITFVFFSCKKGDEPGGESDEDINVPTETISYIKVKSRDLKFGSLLITSVKEKRLELSVSSTSEVKYMPFIEDGYGGKQHVDPDDMVGSNGDVPKYSFILDGKNYEFNAGDELLFTKTGSAKWTYEYTRRRGDK